MSAIASIYLCTPALLEELAASASDDDAFAKLLESAGERPEFGASGYAFAVALSYLDENDLGVPQVAAELTREISTVRSVTCFAFGETEPDVIDELNERADGYDDLEEFGLDLMAQAGLGGPTGEAIRALAEALQQCTGDRIVLVIVG